MESKKTITLHGKTFELYIPATDIHPAITQLAKRISEDYRDARRPVLLVTLNGAVVFGGELFRQLDGEFEIAFVKLSSYGKNMSSQGEVRVDIPLTIDVAGRDVIIAEDVVDTGRTIRKLHHMLTQAGAKSIRTATLLLKPDVYARQADPLPVEYAALESQERFIIGYGLDYDGLGRNLEAIYAVEDE